MVLTSETNEENEKKGKLAWIGDRSSFSEALRENVNVLPELKDLEWEYYSMEDANIPSFFRYSIYDHAKWVFIDFSQNFELMRDVLKIISKYSSFATMQVVAVLDPRDTVFNINHLIDLPISFVVIKKQNIVETLEDMEFFLDPQRVAGEHFKTLGFNYIFWVSFPCKLKVNLDANEYSLDTNADILSLKNSFKKEMKNYLEQQKKDIGELKFSLEGGLFSTSSVSSEVQSELTFKEVSSEDAENGQEELPISDLREWIATSDDQLKISFSTYHFDQQRQGIVPNLLFEVQSTSLKSGKDGYILDFQEQDKKKMKDHILGNKDKVVQKIHEKTDVMIFDPEMRLFMSVFKDSEAMDKINMFNFPRFTSNLRLVNEIRPSLIIINYKIFEYLEEFSETKIDELIELVNNIDNYEPIIIIMNYDSSKETYKYKNLLKVPFEKNDEFLEQIFQLLVKSKEMKYGETNIPSEAISQGQSNRRYEENVFITTPVFIEELTENFCKLKCPFVLKQRQNVFESKKVHSMMVLDPHFEVNPENGEVSAIFTAESESQKTLIRKFVMDLTFSPKTLEQIKELKEFIELNEKSRNKRSREWKKALAEGIDSAD
jgi:hypothetical protein